MQKYCTCTSRHALSKEIWISKIGFDTTNGSSRSLGKPSKKSVFLQLPNMFLSRPDCSKSVNLFSSPVPIWLNPSHPPPRLHEKIRKPNCAEDMFQSSSGDAQRTLWYDHRVRSIGTSPPTEHFAGGVRSRLHQRKHFE